MQLMLKQHQPGDLIPLDEKKTELEKLKTEDAKGTLRKETGKIRKVKKEVARLMTRLNEVKKE